MLDSSQRIQLIERSLRLFTCGLLSLIPVIGLAPALIAVTTHFKIWSEDAGEWNPARPYLIAGYCLAWLGILISLVALALVVLGFMKYYDY